MSDFPTKPGNYYWRNSDRDEWARVFNVRLSNSIGLCVDAGFYHESVEQRGGQWLPIPTAEELVELQAKAKAYDEGEYLLSCIGADLNISLVNISESNYMQQKGYTCRKVRVCKEVEHV